MSLGSTMDTAKDKGEELEQSKPKERRSLLTDNVLYRLIARFSEEQYRPEKYYMRGPGPKAKAKEQERAATRDTALRDGKDN